MTFEDNDEDHLFINKFEELDIEKDGSNSEDSCHGSTDADSEDSYESHFEAMDELAGILGESDDEEDEPVCTSHLPFERPSNPICYDNQFYIPRCSAPAPILCQMNQRSSMKSVYQTNSSAPSSFESKNPMGHYINMSAPTHFKVGCTDDIFSNRSSSFQNYISDDE